MKQIQKNIITQVLLALLFLGSFTASFGQSGDESYYYDSFFKEFIVINSDGSTSSLDPEFDSLAISDLIDTGHQIQEGSFILDQDGVNIILGPETEVTSNNGVPGIIVSDSDYEKLIELGYDISCKRDCHATSIRNGEHTGTDRHFIRGDVFSVGKTPDRNTLFKDDSKNDFIPLFMLGQEEIDRSRPENIPNCNNCPPPRNLVRVSNPTAPKDGKVKNKNRKKLKPDASLPPAVTAGAADATGDKSNISTLGNDTELKKTTNGLVDESINKQEETEAGVDCEGLTEAECDEEFIRKAIEMMETPIPAAWSRETIIDFEKRLVKVIDRLGPAENKFVAIAIGNAAANPRLTSVVEHLYIAHNGQSLLRTGKPHNFDFSKLNSQPQFEKFVTDTSEIVAINELADEPSLWPKNKEEWNDLIALSIPVFVEVGIAVSPIGDTVDLIRAFNGGTNAEKATALAFFLIALTPADTVKDALKTLKIIRKAMVVMRKLRRVRKAAAAAARKGLKTTADDFGNLIIKKGDKIIAKGDDVVKNFLKRSEKFDNLVAKHGDDISKFKPNGLSPSKVSSSTKDALSKASNAPSSLKNKIINELIESGSTAPIKASAKSGDKLVKIVPSGDKVSDFSPYWTTKAELNSLKSSGKLEQKLGLPIGSHAPKYDVFEISAKKNVDTFSSKVAPTTQNGYTTTGGATQTLVLDRTAWSSPVKIDSFIP